jgi:hypothetical protein
MSSRSCCSGFSAVRCAGQGGAYQFFPCHPERSAALGA